MLRLCLIARSDSLAHLGIIVEVTKILTRGDNPHAQAARRIDRRWREREGGVQKGISDADPPLNMDEHTLR
jgi:hypothetical protein